MKQPQGLTNKIILENNLLTKVSRNEVDYFLNRENEIRLYDYFTELDPSKVDFIIYPTNWGYDENKNFFSQFPYLENSYTFLEQPDYSVENYQLIKKLIDDYHQLTPPEMTMFEPETYLDKFRQQIKNPYFDLSEFEGRLTKIMKHYYDDHQICFSHNDLTAGNFLYLNKNEVKIIDYEYSMLNHQLFDYGSFLTETINFNGTENDFLQLLNLSEKEATKLHDIMFYQLILWINWCNYMDEVQPNPIYYQLALQKYETLKAGK